MSALLAFGIALHSLLAQIPAPKPIVPPLLAKPAAPPALFVGEGVLHEVGTAPFIHVQLDTEDGQKTILHAAAPQDEELRHLNGVRVRITGVRGDPLAPAPESVRVDHYEILDVGGGIVPRLGWIAHLMLGGMTHVLFVDERGTAERLNGGWAKALGPKAGARIWMVGTRQNGIFEPSRYALLRRPPQIDPDPKATAPTANPQGEQ